MTTHNGSKNIKLQINCWQIGNKGKLSGRNKNSVNSETVNTKSYVEIVAAKV